MSRPADATHWLFCRFSGITVPSIFVASLAWHYILYPGPELTCACPLPCRINCQAFKDRGCGDGAVDTKMYPLARPPLIVGPPAFADFVGTWTRPFEYMSHYLLVVFIDRVLARSEMLCWVYAKLLCNTIFKYIWKCSDFVISCACL